MLYVDALKLIEAERGDAHEAEDRIRENMAAAQMRLEREGKTPSWEEQIDHAINSFLTVGLVDGTDQEWITEADQIEMRGHLKELVATIRQEAYKAGRYDEMLDWSVDEQPEIEKEAWTQGAEAALKAIRIERLYRSEATGTGRDWNSGYRQACLDVEQSKSDFRKASGLEGTK